jgi:hypothetical protein
MPRSGLSRRFHELKRTSSDRVTPSMLVQLAHTYGVSLQALSGRLEDLGLIPAGTWERLRERNFQSRLAARMQGPTRRVPLTEVRDPAAQPLRRPFHQPRAQHGPTAADRKSSVQDDGCPKIETFPCPADRGNPVGGTRLSIVFLLVPATEHSLCTPPAGHRPVIAG